MLREQQPECVIQVLSSLQAIHLSPKAGGNGTVPMWTKRTLLAKTEVALGGLLEQLDQVADECSQHQQSGGGPLMNEDKFQASVRAAVRFILCPPSSAHCA